MNYLKELGAHCVGVVDPNYLRHSYITETYGVPCYAMLPKHVEFTHAVIATPPDTHVPLALPLLEQGKFVLIEKPVAHSVEEVALLKPFASRAMCGFVYLYHPTILTLRRLLDVGDEIDHLYMRRTNDGPVREWANAAWDLATHDVAISTFFFGMPLNIRGHISRHYAQIHLEHLASDTLIYASWKGGPKIRRIEVVWNAGPERQIFDDVQTVLPTPPLREMLTTFLRGGWDSRGSVEFALKVTRVLEELHK